MHPPLTLHRHPMCIEIIELFQKCHAEHPIGKFFGECTELKIKLDRCFREEKALRRKANFEESKKLKERLKAYRKVTEEKASLFKKEMQLALRSRIYKQSIGYQPAKKNISFASMETILLNEQNVKKGEPVTLVSPRNPTPTEICYLSNIDQTVAFHVETVFFYEIPEGSQAAASNIIEQVKKAVSEVLLIPYYFMAGRLRFNLHKSRLELVCNNKGILFGGATSSLRLKELGNLSFPNPSFQYLILSTEGYENLADTPIFSIQVTRFRCGGFSVGFVTNHSILDGRSAAEMFMNLASICRGEGMKTHELNIDRSCIRARHRPQIKFQHTEYTKVAEPSTSSFTSPIFSSQTTRLSRISNFKLVSFSPAMISCLKNKSEMNCSSFEAVVAHLWRTRTKAAFSDPTEMSSVLFAVDIRSRMSPPLPNGFIGNAVITASASASVEDLGKKSFSFCVRLVREAIDRVSDEYVRSVIDWLEVYRGVPSALNGNFFVSAWWKLPFYELDFGYGRPIYGGPVISGMEEFVLLLSDGSCMGKEKESGINVWIALEQEKMKKFQSYVYEI